MAGFPFRGFHLQMKMYAPGSNLDSTESCVDLEVIEHLEQQLALLGVEHDDAVLTDTAILMGDPGCKGVLTLHNLVAEEEAALEAQLGRPITLQDLEEPNPINLPWRHFSCAGDDHTAVGPDSYLDNIGHNHEKNQMVISTGKHQRSLIGGYYCERVMFKNKHTKFVSKDRLSYDEHILVDSIKVRLLSPETKDREAEVDTNPAIGKARLLYKQLLWSPPGWERTLNVLVQRRFFGRMRKHLPKLPNGDICRRVELPSCIGGIGMSPPFFEGWDLENVLSELSDGHLRLIQHALKGIPLDAFAERALSKYASDRYARGVKLDDAVDLIIDRLFDLHETVSERQAVAAAVHQYKLRDNIGYRTIQKYVSKLGYETKFTLKSKLARAMNQEFLLSSSNNRGFNHSTWDARHTSYEADILIACVTNEVEVDYDLKFIYDKIKTFKNSEQLQRSIRTKQLYLDPTIEVTTASGETYSILRDLKENTPSTQLPPTRQYV
nr:MAG: RNA-dependent RNA polymerase [Streptophyte associated narna-like virus 15]